MTRKRKPFKPLVDLKDRRRALRLSDDLYGAFIWRKVGGGYRYWSEVQRRLSELGGEYTEEGGT